MFKDILYSGFYFTDEERELKFEYLFFNSLLFFNICFVGLAAFVRYLNGQNIQMFFDLVYVFLGLIVVFISRLSKKYFKKLVYFVILYSFIIVIFLFYRENNDFISVGWLFVLLFTTSFLLKGKEKTIVFFSFILFVVLIEIYKNRYTYEDIILSIIPFFITILFLYFFEEKNTKLQKELKLANNLLKQHSQKLDEELQDKKRELEVNFEEILQSLVEMIEDRDTYTGGHSRRVAKYSLLIAKDMNLSEKESDLLYRAAILHDIGKISTPDSVLLKPSSLTETEYEIIQEHVTSSYNILAKMPIYKELADIIICHHERYDGKGYPKGLKGDEIPLLSQIMIVADAFDAMTTSRIYKDKKGIKEAIEELKKCSSKQFSPKVVNSAVNVLEKVVLDDNICQLPFNKKEKERFSYFYKDQITEVNNSFYLKYILSQSVFIETFPFINIVYLNNFTAYNKNFGWYKGDVVLKKFAKYLTDTYKNALVFRIFGDDFLLLSEQDLEINVEILDSLEIFESTDIKVSYKKYRTLDYINLQKCF